MRSEQALRVRTWVIEGRERLDSAVCIIRVAIDGDTPAQLCLAHVRECGAARNGEAAGLVGSGCNRINAQRSE